MKNFNRDLLRAKVFFKGCRKYLIKIYFKFFKRMKKKCLIEEYNKIKIELENKDRICQEKSNAFLSLHAENQNLRVYKLFKAKLFYILY